MIERGDRPRFGFEASAAIGAFRNVGRQELDRDRAIEPRIAALVDFAHPAHADERHDFVRSEPGSRGQHVREPYLTQISRSGRKQAYRKPRKSLELSEDS